MVHNQSNTEQKHTEHKNCGSKEREKKRSMSYAWWLSSSSLQFLSTAGWPSHILGSLSRHFIPYFALCYLALETSISQSLLWILGFQMQVQNYKCQCKYISYIIYTQIYAYKTAYMSHICIHTHIYWMYAYTQIGYVFNMFWAWNTPYHLS